MDIDKCEGINCHIKNECFRYTSPVNSVFQYWHNHEYNNGCKFFWKSEYKPTKQIR